MGLYAPQYGVKKKRVIRDDDGKTKDKAKANLGKDAETIVERYLKEVKAEHKGFDFQRLHDAHTSGGFFPSQIADFEFFSTTSHGCIEVKQIQHDYRLPQGKFKAAKIARLERREQAGALIFIVVRFMPLDVWRVVPLRHFLKDPTATSWDLSDWTARSVDGALRMMLLPRGY